MALTGFPVLDVAELGLAGDVDGALLTGPRCGTNPNSNYFRAYGSRLNIDRFNL